MRAPEADERPVREGEQDDVGGTQTEGPEPVRPHLGDPFPVPCAVEHAERRTSRGAGRRVIADGALRRHRQQRTERRPLCLRVHPVRPRHERNALQVVERAQLVGMKVRGVPATAMEGALRVRPLAQAAELEQLERPQLLPRHRLVLRIPELGSLRHCRSWLRPPEGGLSLRRELGVALFELLEVHAFAAGHGFDRERERIEVRVV